MYYYIILTLSTLTCEFNEFQNKILNIEKENFEVYGNWKKYNFNVLRKYRNQTCPRPYSKNNSCIEREKKIKIRSKANIENETFLEIGENENLKQVPALDECMSYQHLYRRIVQTIPSKKLMQSVQGF